MADEILRPEHKHSEAIAMRRGDVSVTSLPLYETIMDAINESRALTETAPVTLHGVSTQEYCIVPCLYSDQDTTVTRVVQALRGSGWFADLFRISESMDNPDKYRHAVLVSWDPRVISASYSPRFYSNRDSGRIPCSICQKQKSNLVDECGGCAVIKLWLAGVAGMKAWSDPCEGCFLKKKKGDAVTCHACPAKQLWTRRQNGEFGENKKGAQKEKEESEDASPQG